MHALDFPGKEVIVRAEPEIPEKERIRIMLKVAAFDFDGTIADTIPLALKSWRETMRDYGITMGDAELLACFGKNELGIMRDVVGPEKAAGALELFYRNMERLHDLCSAPFSGIPELFAELHAKNIPIVLITGRSDRCCDISLDRMKLRPEFAEIRTGQADRVNKTDHLREVMKNFGVRPEELVYLGDAASDALACREAGVRCISAGWGTSAPLEELRKVNPGMVFPSVSAASEWILARV